MISASVNSLNLKFNEHAPHIHKLIQAHDPASQITPKIEAISNAINLISTRATRVNKLDYYLSAAPRNEVTNTSCILNHLKYTHLGSQTPKNTQLAKRNAAQC